MLTTDTHCHLIPGIDDGSRTRAETLLMAEGLARVGVERVHVTPHQFRFGNDLDPADVRAWTAEIATWLEGDDIPLEVRPGAEYLFGERLLDALQNREDLLTWEAEPGDDPARRMLIELPLREPVVGVSRVAELLLPMGIRPVMAHPERVTSVQQDPSRVERWAAAGWQFQLDLLSLATAYGRHAKRLARKLLLDQRYAFTGSDLHRPAQLRDLEAARLTYQRLAPEPKP